MTERWLPNCSLYNLRSHIFTWLRSIFINSLPLGIYFWQLHGQVLTTQSLLRHAKAETQQALFHNIFCVSTQEPDSESIVLTTMPAASSPAWHWVPHGPLPTEQFQGCPVPQHPNSNHAKHSTQSCRSKQHSPLFWEIKNNFWIPKGTETHFIPS